jgi:hypothetical protein
MKMGIGGDCNKVRKVREELERKDGDTRNWNENWN